MTFPEKTGKIGAFMKPVQPYNKYFYYKKAVQSPEEDVKFFTQVYRSVYKKNPVTLREDFCGTFSISVAWILAGGTRRAVAVDTDKEPLDYGKTRYLSRLKKTQKERLTILRKNVLNPSLPGADIISVSNFSYYIFKERKKLLEYFKKVRGKLKKTGLFIIDVFGGSDTDGPNEDIIKNRGFVYYWDQKSFDPVTNQAVFYIHFKRAGERKRQKQFTYDWRMWSLPELKDVLEDAGFSKIHVYWETSDKKGAGTGIFRKKNSGEPCDSWVAYLTALP